jgi:hypothetical protein
MKLWRSRRLESTEGRSQRGAMASRHLLRVILTGAFMAAWAGCTAPRSSPAAGSVQAGVPAPVNPGPAAGDRPEEAVAEILRVAPRPVTAELTLFAANADGSLRPFRRGAPVVGTDTGLSPAEAGMDLVLLVRAPGFIPQAYEFVPVKIADFFPDLRPVPASGPAVLRGEAEERGDEVRRLLEDGKIVDPPAGP